MGYCSSRAGSQSTGSCHNNISEHGWRRFLETKGVGDWVVLHGGAIAVVRVSSLAEAARLAEAVAQIQGLDGALLTLTDDRLSVRLTRGVFRLEERHIEVALAVSAVAREYGASADRTLAHEVQLARSLRHAMHVDVSVAREQAEQRLAAALAAGGHIVDDSDAPMAWILADGAGNRVCIAAWADGAARPE
jgi:4a-hydroxytetrahydrobiopterin dehydratase